MSKTLIKQWKKYKKMKFDYYVKNYGGKVTVTGDMVPPPEVTFEDFMYYLDEEYERRKK